MNNGDMPAMPRDCAKSHISTVAEDALGLSKREYFAGLAMQGFCAAPDTGEWSTETLAECAVRQADALLAELEETK